MLEAQLKKDFPLLEKEGFECASPIEWGYNCHAFAMGETSKRWDPANGYHWPGPRESTLKAFREVFGTKGYKSCNDGELEEGFEKIAIYCDASGAPKHTARQIADGSWVSKLGANIDIKHTFLRALEGGVYGKVTAFLKRSL